MFDLKQQHEILKLKIKETPISKEQVINAARTALDELFGSVLSQKIPSVDPPFSPSSPCSDSDLQGEEKTKTPVEETAEDLPPPSFRMMFPIFSQFILTLSFQLKC